MSIWKQLMDYMPLFLLAFATTWIPAYLITMLPIWAIGKLMLGGIVSFTLYFTIYLLFFQHLLSRKVAQTRIFFFVQPTKNVRFGDFYAFFY